MTLETYVMYCVLGLLIGCWIIISMLWSLNRRLEKLEKKLNMEDAVNDDQRPST